MTDLEMFRVKSDGESASQIDDSASKPAMSSRKKKILLGCAGVAAVSAIAAIFAIPGTSAETGISQANLESPQIGGAANLPLEQFLKEASDYSLTRIEDAISPPGSIPGSLLAALVNECPNYAFTWARDQALVYQVVINEYATLPPGAKRNQYEEYLKAFASHTHQIYKKNGNPVQSGGGREWSLAEAKHNLDGSMFKEGWCSPQTDGPAVRAIVLIEFAEIYERYHPNDNYIQTDLYKSSVVPDVNSKNPIKRDLEWLYNNWDIENCEPWEEIRGKHFYNRVVARRAFRRGAAFARKLGDIGAANAYEGRIPQVEAAIAPHWKANLGTIQPEEENRGNRLNDVQTILATIHSYSEEDGFWGVNDSRTFANALYTIKAFDSYFSINSMNWKNQPDLGVAIGRYTGDIYNGFCPGIPADVCPAPCKGQPWFLATNGVGEFCYKSAYEFEKAGSITIDNLSKDFYIYYGAGPILEGENLPVTFNKGTDKYQKLITILIQAGDSFVKRTRYHTDENFRMDEQYNGVTGRQMSAVHLTWAYGSLFTANHLRKKLEPSTLIPSYTGAEIDAHVAVVRVPLDVTELVLVGDTAALGNGDACAGAKMYKRREAAGFAEWSTFVKLPKSTTVTAKPASITGGCQSPVYPESDDIVIKTGTANDPEPYYSAWCSTAGCVIPDFVTATFYVVDVPADIDSIAIVGNQPELSNWVPCEGKRAVKQSDGAWRVQITVPSQLPMEFKAIGIAGDTGSTVDCGGIQWEFGGNNGINPLFSDTTIVDVWGCPNCQAPPPTTPPTPTAAPVPTVSPTESPTKFVVTVPLTIVNQNVPDAPEVRVVGNTDSLGNWEPCNGVLATKTGNDWVVTVDVPEQYNLRFKAIRYNSANQCTSYVWEPNSDNTLFTGEAGQTVYNPWGV